MYKTDAAGNVAGEYTNGVPGVTPPTIVDATHLNAIQDEICNVITALGTALNKADSTQLLAAIRALADPTLLTPFVTYNKAALTLDGAWHTLTVAGVPAGAEWMYIGGYVANLGSPDNAQQQVQVRPSGAGQAMLVSQTNGVTGAYQNDCAIGPVLVPCNGSHLDYNISAALNDINLVIYGYK